MKTQRASLTVGVAATLAMLAACSAGTEPVYSSFGAPPPGDNADTDPLIDDSGDGDLDDGPAVGTWGAESADGTDGDGSGGTDMGGDDAADADGDEETGEPPVPQPMVDPLAPRVEYTFDDGAGATVSNSGELAGYDLSILNAGAVTWLGSALRIDQSTRLSSPGAAATLVQAIVATDAFSVEAWIAPSSVNQEGPARIVSLSHGSDTRNVTLGQGVVPRGGIDYLARIRTPVTNNNGLFEGNIDPIHAGPGVITASLSHVVLTHAADGTTRLYVDGVVESSATLAGTLDGWSANFGLHLAGEASSNRPWLGTYHYVAIFDRALTPADVSSHLAAGPA